MKRVRDILLAVVAVMIAVACGESRHISDTHKQAEAVMQEYPDSALALLTAINPDELTTDRGRAMHALLLSQAYDKNYIDLTDDSLITIGRLFCPHQRTPLRHACPLLPWPSVV